VVVILGFTIKLPEKLVLKKSQCQASKIKSLGMGLGCHTVYAVQVIQGVANVGTTAREALVLELMM
jgi:hypothetical protein